MAALALRLAGSIPFGSVAVLPLAAADTAAEAPDVEQLVGTEGTATVRVALVAEPGPEGDLDLDRARALVAALGRPARGRADAGPVVEAAQAAYAAASPAMVVARLEVALADGVAPRDVDDLRRVAAPILGD